MINFYPHQEEALNVASGKKNVAFYHDMGLGKTFTGAEQLTRYKTNVNLVVCQKSKLNDWLDHFKSYYPNYLTLDLTDKSELKMYLLEASRNVHKIIGVINYDLIWRRPELSTLNLFSLLLDESSLIQNDSAKRTKFILKLHTLHNILLSGSPTGGKYEKLYSQLKLMGMKSSKTTFYNTYVNYHYEEYTPRVRTLVVDGYKNIERLKAKMRDLGCQFLKSDEVIDLPNKVFSKVKIEPNREYKKFRKSRVVSVDGIELVGDNTLTKLLYERQLCGIYSKDKLSAFKDLVESTNDRLIVFYNFTAELDKLCDIAQELSRPISIINGSYKNLNAYENKASSITFVQYQAGAMGLNLQKANKIIYYTPTLSSELYEQSKKRIHRIGQSTTCFYYNLIVKGSVEESIYRVLAKREDYTNKLFEEDRT